MLRQRGANSGWEALKVTSPSLSNRIVNRSHQQIKILQCGSSELRLIGGSNCKTQEL